MHTSLKHGYDKEPVPSAIFQLILDISEIGYCLIS